MLIKYYTSALNEIYHLKKLLLENETYPQKWYSDQKPYLKIDDLFQVSAIPRNMFVWSCMLCNYSISCFLISFQIFHSIDEKCGLTDPDDDAIDESDMLHAMDLDELEDIVIYASDICFTVQRFLEVYPNACCVFLSVSM